MLIFNNNNNHEIIVHVIMLIIIIVITFHCASGRYLRNGCVGYSIKCPLSWVSYIVFELNWRCDKVLGSLNVSSSGIKAHQYRGWLQLTIVSVNITGDRSCEPRCVHFRAKRTWIATLGNGRKVRRLSPYWKVKCLCVCVVLTIAFSIVFGHLVWWECV